MDWKRSCIWWFYGSFNEKMLETVYDSFIFRTPTTAQFVPANGGDSVKVVQAAARHASRHPTSVPRLVLLDEDRIERDMQYGRVAEAVASKNGLSIV